MALDELWQPIQQGALQGVGLIVCGRLDGGGVGVRFKQVPHQRQINGQMVGRFLEPRFNGPRSNGEELAHLRFSRAAEPRIVARIHRCIGRRSRLQIEQKHLGEIGCEFQPREGDVAQRLKCGLKPAHLGVEPQRTQAAKQRRRFAGEIGREHRV